MFTNNKKEYNTVAFVPIRLNSKRIKNKNLLKIKGRPIICWCLETLDELGIPVFVYASDTKKLKPHIDFSPQNIIFMDRPISLDSDDTLGIDIYKSFCSAVKSEVYMLCHCTSPFVSAETYKNCIKAVENGAVSSLTVKRHQTFAWYNGDMLNFSLPRKQTQHINPVYIETSGAYCFTKKVIEKNSRSCGNPTLIEVDSIEAVDIDDKNDLAIFNFLK